MNRKFLDEINNIIKFSYSPQRTVNGSNNNNRSARKVDPLHGRIAIDLQEQLGENYQVETKVTTGSESKIPGRYIEKKVDVVVRNLETNDIVCGIGVKVPLNTFEKNKNNYFENMLGETANIRSSANNIPYYQIIVLPSSIPSFTTKNGSKCIKSIYTFTEDKLNLYKTLSMDNALAFYHTPVKTLLAIVDVESFPFEIGLLETAFKEEASRYYDSNELNFYDMNLECEFGKNIIFNDYKKFIEKISYLTIGFD